MSASRTSPRADSEGPRRPARRLPAVGFALIVAAAPASVAAPVLALAPAAAPAPRPVNPLEHPVVVRGEVPVESPDAPMRLRVRTPAGTTVAVTAAQAPAGGRVIVRWAGLRGIGASGDPVRDGRYLLHLETEDGLIVPTTPEVVEVDTRAPAPRLRVPEPVIPAPARVRLPLRITERDRGDEFPVMARALVTSLAGERLGVGPWRPAEAEATIPDPVLRSGRSGAVRVVVQARDAAGNRGESAPAVVSLPGRPGPARRITRVSTRRPLVALTIDDGYDSGAVASMVATATRMRAPVTMCLNGSAAAGYSASLRARLRAATAAGWLQVCNHGRSHGIGSRMSYAALRADLTGNVVWDRAAGQSSGPFYRPPYGDVGGSVIPAAASLGYRDILLWDVDTNDWRYRDTSRAVSYTIAHASRGSIVLMHAIPSSAAALPAIISGLRARGLEPVAIGDLLAAG